MVIETPQINFWLNDFGKEYTDRNTSKDLNEWDKEYIKLYGVSRIDMYNEFLSDIEKDIKILEVGCNIGQQLSALQSLGFENLYGIELQSYAVEKAKEKTQNINIIQGNAFDIPFKDEYFDLVMTNGVLIHICPNDLPKALAEIMRCTKKNILGFEYYSDKEQEINYRGHDGFLWKMDYMQKYIDLFPGLSLVKQKQYHYTKESENGNTDNMFLLAKT